MLAAGPVASGVYYVDDHFVPYTGAKPVAKGWNNKRGKAERGRADTHVTAHDGRAVCFVTGEPSGLSVTLPKALAELKKAAGPGAKIMLGFDRGGAARRSSRTAATRACTGSTYRRAPLAIPAMLPVITAVTSPAATGGSPGPRKSPAQGLRRSPADHPVRARQGRPAVLTSDFGACPAEILSWLKSRWREESFLKYASENYGIDKICDYLASIETNTKLIRNPPATRRTPPSATRRRPSPPPSASWPGCRGPGHHPRRQERPHPRPAEEDHPRPHDAGRRHHGRKPIPAKLPASTIDPDARVALLRAGRRGLQWPCGCSPTTPSTGYQAISTPTSATTTSTAPSPARPSSAACRHHHLDPRRDHRPARPARLHPRRPRPRTAHRRDQRHPARHARRQPPHHLPPRTPARHLTPDAQPSPEI